MIGKNEIRRHSAHTHTPTHTQCAVHTHVRTHSALHIRTYVHTMYCTHIRTRSALYSVHTVIHWHRFGMIISPPPFLNRNHVEYLSILFFELFFYIMASISPNNQRRGLGRIANNSSSSARNPSAQPNYFTQDDGINTPDPPLIPFESSNSTGTSPVQIQTAQAQIANQQKLWQQPRRQQQQLAPMQGGYSSAPIYTDNSTPIGPSAQKSQSGYRNQKYQQPGPQLPAGQGPFYGPASNPMFGPAQGTVQMKTKNVTTTSVTSVSLGTLASASALSAVSDESKCTGASSTNLVVPGRITDTEVRLKISGDLPLWYKQEKKKYCKHMLHLFATRLYAFVSWGSFVDFGVHLCVSFGASLDWLIDCSIVRLIDWLSKWLIDWLIEIKLLPSDNFRPATHVRGKFNLPRCNVRLNFECRKEIQIMRDIEFWNFFSQLHCSRSILPFFLQSVSKTLQHNAVHRQLFWIAGLVLSEK